MAKQNGYRNIANITFSINVAVPEQVFVEIERQTKLEPIVKPKRVVEDDFDLYEWSENITNQVAELLHEGKINIGIYNALTRCGAAIVTNRHSGEPCANCYKYGRSPIHYPDFITWLKHIAVGKIHVYNIGSTRKKMIGELI